MTTAYTSLLGLALPVTGELSGTWGDTVNDSITSLLDTAVAGTTNVSADSNVTLTTTTGASNQARQAILLFSGARTAIRTVTAPAQSKIYTVINATTGGFAVQLVGAGPTTGVTIANGARTVVAWNGSDFVEVSRFSDLVVYGNVGIGTSSPAVKLQVQGAASSNPEIRCLDGTVNSQWYASSDGTCIFGTYSNHPLVFRTNGSECARIDSSGNFGIGTTSPASKLQVNGSLFVTGRTVPSSGSGPELYWSGTQSYLLSFNRTSPAYLPLVLDGSSQLFNINGVTALTIDSSGNLGLGVTPNAWRSASKAFQINSTASIRGETGLTALISNAYTNTSSQNIYITSDYATQYAQFSGSHVWYNAPSGTAGNAITFTQAMTLAADGNLGVGTTSPSGAAGTSIVVNGKSNQARIALKNDSTGDAAGDGFQLGLDSSGLGCFIEQRENAEMRFLTNATERARITSDGLFLFGTSSAFNSGYICTLNDATQRTPLAIKSSVSCANSYLIRFVNDSGTDVGAVVMNSGNNGVNFTSLSDYRLKENIQPMVGALAKVAALKPCTYTWKDNGVSSQGFIAHELQEVVPDAVVGKKDAVNEDGSIKPQGIAVSNLVATLTAAIQEQQAIIESLKARLDAANL